VIVDAHTHIFPAQFVRERDAILRAEPVMFALYGSPKAAMATAEDLLRVMDDEQIDYAVVAGVTWTDLDRCREHNDALLAAAVASGGRIVPFCGIPAAAPEQAIAELDRCAAAGAAGFGELRLDLYHHAGRESLPDLIAQAACRYGLPLLLHATEPVGHSYPGKDGGRLDAIWALLVQHPNIVTILAHLGGGLPFFAFMPEVRALFNRTYIDTAAVPWLYDAAAIVSAVRAVGVERVLFGTDFPLRRPGRDLQWLSHAGLDHHELSKVQGGNAASLLKLERRVH